MRTLLIVLDGLGVGEMDDVKRKRPQDAGAFTLRSIVTGRDHSLLKNFVQFGLGNIADSGLPKNSKHLFSYGKAKLAHHGADTFLGHQEIAGTKPVRPVLQFVRDIADKLANVYRKNGHEVKIWGKNKDMLIIDEAVVISDNLEADAGQIINVIGSLDDLSFDEIRAIGEITRKMVKNSRVLYMGAKGIDLPHILSGARESVSRNGKIRHIGVDVPQLDIYDKAYNVYHHGYGVDPSVQVTGILAKNNFPVALIGKAADVIECDGAEYYPAVYTKKVISLIKKRLKEQKEGLIFANVQEIDLAGHCQDAGKCFRILKMVDEGLPSIMSLLSKGDLFIITADHGDDPNIGHSNHTREYTPILAHIVGSGSRSILGKRKTLSDIATTISRYFKVPRPQHGKSFLDKL